MIYSDNRKYVQTPWRVTFDKKKFDKEVAVKTFLIDLKHEELRYLNRDTKTVQEEKFVFVEISTPMCFYTGFTGNLKIFWRNYFSSCTVFTLILLLLFDSSLL